MSSELTATQQMILDFIQDRIANGEPPPTYREICKQFGYKSTKAAADHVVALEKKGYLTRKNGRSRGLRLVRKDIGIPILGTIPAGSPSEAVTFVEQRIALDPISYGIRDRSRAFALHVRGDSMVDRQIFEGDLVLLEHGVVPQNGDVVAALIDNESTLKTFIRRGGKIWLRAENPRYHNLIPARDLQIQGVGRAVIRFLSR